MKKSGCFLLLLFLMIQGVGHGQTLNTFSMSNKFYTISKKDTTYKIEEDQNGKGYIGKDSYNYTRRLHTAWYNFLSSSDKSIEIARIKIILAGVSSSKQAVVKIGNTSIGNLGTIKDWYDEVADLSTLATISSTNEIVLERNSIPAGILNLFEGIPGPSIVMGIMNSNESNSDNGVKIFPLSIKIEYYETYKLVVDVKKDTYNFYTTDATAFKLNSQPFPYTSGAFTRYYKENTPIQVEANYLLYRTVPPTYSDTAGFDKIQIGDINDENFSRTFNKAASTQNLVLRYKPVRTLRPYNDFVDGLVETHITGSTFNISKNNVYTGTGISGEKYSIPIDKTVKIVTNLSKGTVSGVSADHQSWDGNLSNYQRFFEFETNSTTPKVTKIHALHHPIYSQTINVSIEGFVQPDLGVQFKDPWKVVNGSRPWSWDTYSRPFTPGYGNDISYGGLFKSINYDSFYPNSAHYRIKTGNLISVGGLDGYFGFWSGTGSTIYDPINLETPVRFDVANATVTANYKGHLRTGVPDLSDAKNQRRLVVDPADANKLLMVYESMEKIWITMSMDGGLTWMEEFLLGDGRNPSLSNPFNPGSGQPARILIVWNGTIGLESELGSLNYASIRLDFNASNFPETKGYNMGWKTVTMDPNPPFNFSYLGKLTSTPPTPPFSCKSTSRPVAVLKGIPDLMEYYIVAENGGIGEGQGYDWLRGLDYTIGSFSPTGDDVGFNGPSAAGWRISENPNDEQPVIIYAPAAYGKPEKFAVYYLATGYASGKRIVEYDMVSETKSVLSTASNDYTYHSLAGAVNSTSASFALVATAQVNYPTTTYNTNIYTKPTYYGNSLPTVSKVYANTVKPAIMVQNTSSFGSPTYQVHMTTNGTTTRVKADGGSTLTTVATNTAGSWLSAQVGSGNRKAMVVRSNSTPATIQYYNGTTQLSKGGDYVVDVRAFRYFTLKNGKSGAAVLDFSGSQVEAIDSLETGENLAVVLVKNPASSGVLVYQPDSLVVPLSVDVIRDGKEIAAYAAASWKSLGTASFADLRDGDVLRFRLADPVTATWGYEEYTVTEEAMAKEDTPEETVEELESLTEGIKIYPNPFNPITTIQVSLAEPKMVRLAVYNILGQMVSELVNGELGAGRHSYSFNGSNLSSGTYFYRLEAGGEVTTGKLQLLK